jgi:hypothetical protein
VQTTEQGSGDSNTDPYPPIEEVIRTIQLDGPSEPIEQSLGEAQAIVVGHVTSIDEPRWNSRDGSDWRVELDETENPSPFHCRIRESISTSPRSLQAAMILKFRKAMTWVSTSSSTRPATCFQRMSRS